MFFFLERGVVLREPALRSAEVIWRGDIRRGNRRKTTGGDSDSVDESTCGESVSCTLFFFLSLCCLHLQVVPVAATARAIARSGA